MNLLKRIILFSICGVILLFAIQNNNTTSFHFLMFSIPSIPVFALILLSFGMGVIFGYLNSWFSSLSKPKKEKKDK